VLNLDLIQAPTTCIDYVITHELCHLKVRDHSRAFYALLTRVMPDWESRKARLERLSS
jgi:predicted metal-dependent hydrolase